MIFFYTDDLKTIKYILLNNYQKINKTFITKIQYILTLLKLF